MLTDFTGINSTRSNILLLAEKLVPGEAVDNRLLMEVYFHIQYLSRQNSGQGLLPALSDIPYRNDRIMTAIETDKEDAERLLQLCPDVFHFLKFGVPGTVKDFTLFRDICSESGLSEQSILPEIVIQIVLTIEDNEDKTADELCTIINTLTEKTVHTKNLSTENTYMLRKSLYAYGLKFEDKVVKSSRKFAEAKDKAYEAAVLLKDTLKVTSIADQLSMCNDYYSGHKSANNLYQKYNYTLTSRFLEDKSTMEIKSLLETLCSKLALSTPRHVLEALHQIKKRRQDQRGERNRETTAQVECGLVYDLFTSGLSLEDSVLVAFPSPFFVRKWSEDNLMKDYRTRFIVSSYEEKNLWENHFARFEKRDNISFDTIDGIVTKRETLYQFNRILVFSLMHEEENRTFPGITCNLSDLAYVISESEQEQTIFCLTANDGFRRRNSFSNTFIRKNMDIEHLISLPNSVESPGKKKKSIWIGSNRKDQNVSTVCYESTKKEGFIYIDRNPAEYHLNLIDYQIKGDDSDIIAFAKEAMKSPPKRTRIAPKLYEFTSDISFWYSSSPDHNYPWKERITAYLNAKDSNVPANENGESESVYNYTSAYKLSSSESDTLSWLENGYPYKLIGKGLENTRKHFIQKRIGAVMRKELEGTSICLKTFLYLYPERLRDVSDTAEVFLKQFAKQSKAGGIPMKFLSQEPVAQSIQELHFTDISEREQTALVRHILNAAVEEKILSSNPMSNSDSPLGKESPRELINLKSALSTKTFTREQFKRFFRLAISKLGLTLNDVREKNTDNKLNRDPDYRFLGVIIMLMTGLERRAISGLFWEDFHMLRDFGVHQLQIYKHYIKNTEPKADEKEPSQWELCKSDTKIRCIPCSDILTYIISRMKKAMGAGTSKKYMLTNTENPMNPDAISKAFKELMNEMGLEKIAEQSIGDDTVELSEYGGVFLVENFRYVASDIACLQPDELAFILGNKPATTFGIYYCDYNNPMSQYMLKIKLNRIDVLLINDSRFSVPKTVELKNELLFGPNGSIYPLQLNIIAENKTDTDSEIEIISDYGTSVFTGDEYGTR